MQKFTIFICLAIYVQTRCFIKEYGLHNYTFHYSETHTACNRTQGCGGELTGINLSPPRPQKRLQCQSLWALWVCEEYRARSYRLHLLVVFWAAQISLAHAYSTPLCFPSSKRDLLSCSQLLVRAGWKEANTCGGCQPWKALSPSTHGLCERCYSEMAHVLLPAIAHFRQHLQSDCCSSPSNHPPSLHTQTKLPGRRRGWI